VPGQACLDRWPGSGHLASSKAEGRRAHTDDDSSPPISRRLVLGPAEPHATTRKESAIHAATRMREVSHQDSRRPRVLRQAAEVTFDPTGSDAGSSELDLIAELVLKLC
jgi:hypothetical protein